MRSDSEALAEPRARFRLPGALEAAATTSAAMRGGCCGNSRRGRFASCVWLRCVSLVSARDAAGGGRSGRRRDGAVPPELQEVVGSVGQAPFGAGGGSAAAQEAVDAAVELGVGEDRLDHRLAFGVELAARVGVKDAAHERVKAAVPAGTCAR